MALTLCVFREKYVPRVEEDRRSVTDLYLAFAGQRNHVLAVRRGVPVDETI